MRARLVVALLVACCVLGPGAMGAQDEPTPEESAAYQAAWDGRSQNPEASAKALRQLIDARAHRSA